MSSTLRTPPPTVSGMKARRAVRSTMSSSVPRPSGAAEMSRETISSAPSAACRAARAGDALVLTKPLGIGIISTAIKMGRAPAEMIAEATNCMKTLNKAASGAMVEAGVRGATDITGFGLLGHLHEMLHRSCVSGRIRLSAVPVILGVRELAKFSVPGGTRANLKSVSDKMSWADGITEEEKLILADAQTSGGLLIAAAPDKLGALLSGLAASGVQTRAVIGEVITGEEGKIFVDR